MYSLSQADIDAYLATKQDGDIVGTTCFRRLCLLARVLHHKYQTDDTSINNGRAWVHGESVVEDGISIAVISNLFDSLRPAGRIGGYPVTKRKWLAADEQREIDELQRFEHPFTLRCALSLDAAVNGKEEDNEHPF